MDCWSRHSGVALLGVSNSKSPVQVVQCHGLDGLGVGNGRYVSEGVA